MRRFYQAPRKREEIGPLRRRGRSGKGKIFLLSLSLIFATSLFTGLTYGKQSNAATTRVAGTVFVQDSAGNRFVVGGATVKLDGPAAFETETDENGNYVVAAVPPGTYTVESVSPGLEIRKTVRVEGDEITVPLELKPSEVTSSVVVKADQAEITNSAPAETVSAKTLREAPNVNERFESSLPLIPGVVRGPDGHINLKGARNTQSGALVNSANVTDPVTGGPAINLSIVGPRNVARFPRFSSFDLQVTRPVLLHFGEKRLHARVGGSVFNLFNHFDPRDVQNNVASIRFGAFFNSSWREYRGKFVMEF